ncbi:fibronectin type III domain-containing protein [Geosporobacter ferrireducens]|uniref:fibronectin type III domain-containing protein n=1 Tax=Geosporobacter ferrireducens TaxID=1424294 RepID=UPI00139CBC4F|nr:hypothetical protein [Geosporobacter ferrireducens]MTI58359.1 hypothetical protein [Geosporobacter ferrireducens]
MKRRGPIKLNLVISLSLIWILLFGSFAYAQDVYTWETPGTHSWTVPQTGKFKIEVWGGMGGKGGGSVYDYRLRDGEYRPLYSYGEEGSPGNYNSTTVTLTKGNVVSIVVGGNGINGAGGQARQNKPGGVGGNGGYPDGAKGGNGTPSNSYFQESGDKVAYSAAGGGGGGGSSSASGIQAKGGNGGVGGDGTPIEKKKYNDEYREIYASGGGGGTGGGAGGSSQWAVKNGKVVITRVNMEPAASITTAANQIFSQQPEFNIINLSGKVYEYDNNNNVTVKYTIKNKDTNTNVAGHADVAILSYVSDGNERSFSRSITINSSFPNGNYEIQVIASDGMSTSAVASIACIVDHNTPPTINQVNTSSTSNSITVSCTAADNIGLHASAYRFSINSTATGWMTNSNHTFNSLNPNQIYAIKAEVRDKGGNISVQTRNVCTKALVPSLSIKNPTSYTLDIQIIDTNPSSTVYQIVNTATNRYLTSSGDETTIPTWIRPNNLIQTVRNLNPQTTYSYKIQAKNQEDIATGFSAPATGTTLATPPPKVGELTATADMNSITIYWPLVNYATTYEIEGDGQILGSVQGTSFTHTGLITNTEHTYRVRGKNGAVAGPWSDPITKSTLPPVPTAPANINSLATRNTITLTWNAVNGATAYDIEVDGNILSNGNSTNYVHSGLIPNTSHTYRVRSINPAGKSGWSELLTVVTQDQELPVPQNVVVEPAKNKVKISWSTIPGLTYEIEVDGNIRSLGALSEYIHDNLLPDTEHSYRVRSVKDGSSSDWSRLIIIRTKADIFTVPSGVKGEADNTQITVSWEAVTNADGYDVDVEGVILDNGNNTVFIHEGLNPNTSHTYRIRARNGSEVSQWSDPLNLITYALAKPGGITTQASETEIAVAWSPVAGAESYEMKIDGNIIRNITGTTYTVTGLLKGTQHTISLQAVNSQGTSAFTLPLVVFTAGEGSKIPQSIGAITTKDQIGLVWEKMNGATGYEVKIGEETVTNLTENSYIHKNLLPNTEYTYSVRITTNEGPGQWSVPVKIKTMAQNPGTPGNLSAAASAATVLVTWDRVTDAEEYEIQIDSQIINVGASNKYLHGGLAPNTQYTYRVRSKNKTGVSPWSDGVTAVTNSTSQEFRVTGAVGEEKDLVVTAANIESFNGYTFTLTYNPEELEIVDLSSLTAKKDEAVGNIAGTDIEVIQNQPGVLQFKKKTIIPQGQAYSGVINSVRFKLKTANEVVITYTTK